VPRFPPDENAFRSSSDRSQIAIRNAPIDLQVGLCPWTEDSSSRDHRCFFKRRRVHVCHFDQGIASILKSGSSSEILHFDVTLENWLSIGIVHQSSASRLHGDIGPRLAS